jgi:CDP-diacylglycerol pyrophosphatase
MRRAWLLVLLAGLAPIAGRAADPSALWKIVNGQCVPHEQAAHDAAPCTEVELEGGVDSGYAVLKDREGVAQFLLIPTKRTSGMDDPMLLSPDRRNYWNAAWQARYLVEGRLKQNLPRDGFALAINSVDGRTQDQFHIHIDCIRPDVRDALNAHLSSVGKTWAPFPVPLAGATYRAIRIEHEDLNPVDPFHVLADNDPAAAADMGHHTLVLVGVDFGNYSRGFVLLDGKANLLGGVTGSGEQLEDHSCAIAGK